MISDDDEDEFSRDLLECPHHRHFRLDRPPAYRPKKWEEMKARVWRIRFRVNRPSLTEDGQNEDDENKTTSLNDDEEAAAKGEEEDGDFEESARSTNTATLRKSASQESAVGSSHQSTNQLQQQQQQQQLLSLAGKEAATKDALERLNIDEQTVLAKIQELKDQKRDYFNQFRRLINEGEQKKQAKVEKKKEQQQQQQQQQQVKETSPVKEKPQSLKVDTLMVPANNSTSHASPHVSPIKTAATAPPSAYPGASSSNARPPTRIMLSDRPRTLMKPIEKSMTGPNSPQGRRPDMISHRYHPYGGGGSSLNSPRAGGGNSMQRSYRPSHPSSSLSWSGNADQQQRPPPSPQHPQSSRPQSYHGTSTSHPGSSATTPRDLNYPPSSVRYGGPQRPSNQRPDRPDMKYPRSAGGSGGGRPYDYDNQGYQSQEPPSQRPRLQMEYRPTAGGGGRPTDRRPPQSTSGGSRPGFDDNQQRRRPNYAPSSSYGGSGGGYSGPERSNDGPGEQQQQRPTMGYRRGSGYGYSSRPDRYNRDNQRH